MLALLQLRLLEQFGAEEKSGAVCKVVHLQRRRASQREKEIRRELKVDPSTATVSTANVVMRRRRTKRKKRSFALQSKPKRNRAENVSCQCVSSILELG